MTNKIQTLHCITNKESMSPVIIWGKPGWSCCFHVLLKFKQIFQKEEKKNPNRIQGKCWNSEGEGMSSWISPCRPTRWELYYLMLWRIDLRFRQRKACVFLVLWCSSSIWRCREESSNRWWFFLEKVKKENEKQSVSTCCEQSPLLCCFKFHIMSLASNVAYQKYKLVLHGTT